MLLPTIIVCVRACSFVYTFGFVSMTPQLYINYRLKSVAAMPWRTMTYKTLNTVVDDVFSFVIKVRKLTASCFCFLPAYMYIQLLSPLSS